MILEGIEFNQITNVGKGKRGKSIETLKEVAYIDVRPVVQDNTFGAKEKRIFIPLSEYNKYYSMMFKKV